MKYTQISFECLSSLKITPYSCVALCQIVVTSSSEINEFRKLMRAGTRSTDLQRSTHLCCVNTLIESPQVRNFIIKTFGWNKNSADLLWNQSNETSSIYIIKIVWNISIVVKRLSGFFLSILLWNISFKTLAFFTILHCFMDICFTLENLALFLFFYNHKLLSYYLSSQFKMNFLFQFEPAVTRINSTYQRRLFRVQNSEAYS